MDLSIVIPFYNEEDNVAQVLKGISYILCSNKICHEIIAVDNGSVDRTGEILDTLSHEIRNLKIVKILINKGYGIGIRHGLNRASGAYIGFMCGDNQIEPQALIEVYNKAVKEDLDLCKVRRIKREDGVLRKIVSFFYNSICTNLFFLKYKDLNGTPKIFKRHIFEGLNFVSERWFIDAEVMIKCSRMGCRIGEVPAVFKKREKGISKVKLNTLSDFAQEMLRYKFKYEKKF